MTGTSGARGGDGARGGCGARGACGTRAGSADEAAAAGGLATAGFGDGFSPPATTSAACANALVRAGCPVFPFVGLRARRGLSGRPFLRLGDDRSSMALSLARRGPAVHGLDILPAYA